MSNLYILQNNPITEDKKFQNIIISWIAVHLLELEAAFCMQFNVFLFHNEIDTFALVDHVS